MKRILLLLCALAAVLALAGCGGGSAGSTTGPARIASDNGPELTPLGGTIVGRVIDLQSGAGISGAALKATLLPEETGIVLTGATDATGRFAFSNLSPGRWQLRASKAHFGDGSANVQVLPITIINMDVALVNQGGQD